MLEIWRKSQREGNEFALTQMSLGHVCEERGDYARAEILMRNAIEIRKKTLGESHPIYGVSLNNLALLYMDLGDFARAEPLYQSSLAIEKKSRGEHQPNYAVNLNNLATLYTQMGDYDRAEPLFRQALGILRETVGENHRNFANTSNNLAHLYAAENDYARAESLYRVPRRPWASSWGRTTRTFQGHCTTWRFFTMKWAMMREPNRFSRKRSISFERRLGRTAHFMPGP